MDPDPPGVRSLPETFLREPAILARHGTSLLPMIPVDTLWLAIAYKPALRCPRAQSSRCRVHSLRSDAAAWYTHQPVGSAPEPAWSALARLGDLVSPGLPPHYDERGRQCRVTLRRVDDFRNVIRCCSE